jgi:acyl-coenzyme A synthetase/AMP-(fatty) acid ligase
MSRPPATTFEYLQFHAANTPDRVALILDDGEYTYGRFAVDALRFTKALADLGIERRQIVSIHHPHFYIEWLLNIACENLGAVSVSDDARNWKRANYLYQHVDVGLTNTPADEEPPFQYHCLADDWVRATLGMDLAIAQEQQVIVPELDDMVRITRSSGSTGIPKLIPLTREIIEYRINQDMTTKGLHHSNPKLLIIGATFALNIMWRRSQTCIRLGGSVIRLKDRVRALIEHDVTQIWALPVALESLLDEIPSNFQPKNNLTIHVGGASLSKSLQNSIRNRLTPNVLSRLGTNEISALLNMKESGVGVLLPGVDVAVYAENGDRVPDGTVGKLAFRAFDLINNYYGNIPAEGRFHNGWFYTGDAGIKIGPRKVKLLGRADDMVIMGGVKVSPLVLEDTLRTGVGIKDAAVVGIKASDGGDLVCVSLVLADDANVEVIRADIHKLWAVYRVRIIIAVVDDLARTENGKVSRAKVRDFFREQLESEVAAS